MKRTKIVSALIASGMGIVLATSVAAKPGGTPNRSEDLPPGLQKAFERMVPGIMNSIDRTEGSNSRLRDLPTSP